MIRKALTLSLLILTSITIIAQEDLHSSSQKKIYLESCLRLGFGDKIRLGMAPAINYQLTPTLSVGTGIIGEYFKHETKAGTQYSTGIYGFNAIVNYQPGMLTNLFNDRTSGYLYFEHEFLNLDNQYFFETEAQGRSWQNATFLGFKIKRMIGPKQRFALSLIVAWNINDNYATSIIYNNPVIKMGFRF